MADDVQLAGAAPHEPSDEAIRSAAAEGVRTPSTALPHLDRIQASFGRHSVAHVQAHVGPEATRASRAMNALAYASGDHVVFGSTPDLRTAAHEAAHIVQQQAGVQLSGGIGRAGDPYERHADAVAEVVAAGRSAEPLLEPFAASPQSSSEKRTYGHIAQRPRVQLKLESTQLNVAGESHNESKPRREEEKKFVYDKTGSDKYWIEQEFTQEDEKTLADPPDLRYCHRLCAYIQDFEKVFRVGHYNELNLEVQTADLLEKIGKKEHLETIKSLAKTMKQLHREAEKANPDVITASRKLGEQTKFLHDAWAHAYQVEQNIHLSRQKDSGGGEDESSKTTLEIACEGIAKSGVRIQEELTEADSKWNVRTANFGKIRSERMHVAAESRQATRGVWKVGQRHVNDMGDLPSGSRSSNLVTRTDFNTELGQWRDDPKRRALPDVQDESDHEQQPGKKFLDNSAKPV